MGTPVATSPLADLEARLPQLMLRDQYRLRRRLDAVRKGRRGPHKAADKGRLDAEFDAAETRVANRRAAVPAISYPQALPVSQKKDDILAAIRDHQVVIVAGETGSGKTTQIPKICLELGRGVQGLIGHTQPRRIAARTVGDRIAEELGGQLGDVVGYKVRFTDQSSDSTLVKLMTDGILLAEVQNDRMLRQYDTLIIDEAHERSLNIDFLLGYLKQLLPRRPDLKVIITSATIDPERFSQHFDDAPIIEVSGRTYPVEVRYRPLVADAEDGDDDEGDAKRRPDDRDQVQAISDAVDELMGEASGDILVFLSGEREIRDTAEALNKRQLRNTEVLPLYARLSAAEQHRVFQQHSGRRIVLATNVAETSLTVPGIKYVIDPGTARISRYSLRTKVQRLPIEAVSQASANQRKGRSGRTSDGICIRLYSESDFESRPEFTDPEILRTNLASVILQMTALDLGDIAAFPFVEPPDRRNIKDGVQLLHELGAIDPDEQDHRKRLTPIGRKLSQLPVDPRLARMILEAERNGVVREVLIIASALSIQDPRERPADQQQHADQMHARFADKESDFLAYLNLWNYIKEQRDELSSSRFRKMCKSEFLHYLRIREWQDLHSQLRQAAKSIGIEAASGEPQEPNTQFIHTAILSGLLSHIGLMDAAKREYGGARGTRFSVFPGSALFKKPPRWVMAAELVETSKLWARIAGRIEPEWIEPLAGHLIKRTYSEPHWELKMAAVMAYEKVTLYGVPIVAARKVGYGKVDPEMSRDLFIRHALVEGDWRTHHKFFAENRRLLADVEELEHRARRRDIMVDDETLFDFYDERIPADVVSGRHFDAWWKKAQRAEPDLLSFEKSMLINAKAGGITEENYPNTWVVEGIELKLTYQFEPGSDADGVTAHIPVAVLNQLTGEGFDWQIPGLREELVTSYIRSLPKNMRRGFVPAPDYARSILTRLKPGRGSLVDVLERELSRMAGMPVKRETWDLSKIPEHLRMTFRVLDDNKRTLAEGKDLEELKLKLRDRMRAAVSEAASTLDMERSGVTSWTIGELPRVVEQKRGPLVVKAYPALVDEGASVAVRLFDREPEQMRSMWLGTRRLVLLNVQSPVKQIQGRLPNMAKLTLSHNPHGGIDALFEDILACASDMLIVDAGGPAWDEAGFAKLRERVKAGLPRLTEDTVVKVERILGASHNVAGRLKTTRSPALAPALADLKAQYTALIHKGFVAESGWRRLPDVHRYLQAMERRLQRLEADPVRDRERMLKVHQIQAAYQELMGRQAKSAPIPTEIAAIRWQIEELRVSYFAQSLGTPQPVSDKRILKTIEELAG
ncbi:ATP-dependent RNA helicase HrpA [Streptomyces sp. SID3343]|uniref:ATP-dependent RNA helicase HrpA n=1 Tax=Streptomyces sp. SID3343 TaxID=2690260 RepID=UPI00136FDB15|nr:ATP-dependent RNA helicase HrpA [Streptomyces sp. SID3343]MYW01273.1 ATP-dependent RNA helicase HrpA [Streptomyces sp. SID3343]